jgi:chemotaxis signal transduction protein
MHWTRTLIVALTPGVTRPIVKEKAVVLTSQPSAALLVRVGEHRYGLPLTAVERVLPMAAVLPLPEADSSMLGVLNLHGSVLPVVDPRSRLGMPTPDLTTDQRLVLLRGKSAFLMWVDEVEDVVTLSPEALTAASGTLVSGVMRLGETIVPLLAPAAFA